MTHRGPFQPLLFCDSVKSSSIYRGLGCSSAAPGVLKIKSSINEMLWCLRGDAPCFKALLRGLKSVT